MLAIQTLQSWHRTDEAQAAGARAAELEAEVARLHDLTTQLEDDLAAASGGGSGGGAKAQRSSSVGASVGGDITCVLSAAAAASENGGGGGGGGGEGGCDDAAAPGERSMVEVLCAQRDRLRDRAARLEEGAGLGSRVVGFRVEWGSWLAGRELKSFARALRRGVQRCLAARRCWMQGDAAVAQLLSSSPAQTVFVLVRVLLVQVLASVVGSKHAREQSCASMHSGSAGAAAHKGTRAG